MNSSNEQFSNSKKVSNNKKIYKGDKNKGEKNKKSTSAVKRSKSKPKKFIQHIQNWGKEFIGKDEQGVQTIHMSDKVYEIVSGEHHLFLVTKKKKIYGIGSNDHGQLGLPNMTMTKQPLLLPFSDKVSVNRIFLGTDYSFCLSKSNQVFSWGLNIEGQLGLGHYESVLCPTLVKSLSHFTMSSKKSENKNCILKTNEVITEISCGAIHTLALSNKSRVYSVGFGDNYSLGHSSNKTINEFKQISYFNNTSSGNSLKIDKICCGISHSGALINGKVYIWGTFADSKYSINKNPSAVKLPSQVADFVLGDMLSVMLTKNGEIYTLGDNTYHQLGSVEENNVNYNKVDIPYKIEYICCGLNHVIAINNSKGKIFGWGSNHSGQIHPYSSEKVFKTPFELPWMDAANPYIITCGSSNTLLVSAKKVQVNKHSKNSKDSESILILKKEIERMKRMAKQMNRENQRLKEEISVLHSTVNSHMDSINESFTNGNDEVDDSDSKQYILSKFK